MYIDYIRGKMITELSRTIDYWSMVKLDTIRKTLVQKLQVYTKESQAEDALTTSVTAKITKNTVKVSFGTDTDAFNYFLQRKQLL